MHNQINGITQYLSLRNQNDALALENATLRNLLQNYQAADSLSEQEVRDSLSGIYYRFLPARVIANSVNQQNNHLIINKGKKDGIRPEMAVICPGGIVGITKSVSENYAFIISALNRNIKISSKIKRNGYFGSLSWDGRHPRQAELTEIPFHVDLRQGDTLVTSGYSAIFPEGIPVGTILSFSKPAGSNFYSIRIKLETDFQKLDYVYVVTHLLKDQIQQMEKETSENGN